jgi:hypothetical protein
MRVGCGQAGALATSSSGCSAGTSPSPGGGASDDQPNAPLRCGHAALQDPKQFLFFTRTPNGRQADKEFLARLKERTQNRDKAISLRSYAPSSRPFTAGAWSSLPTCPPSTSPRSSQTARATR